MNDDLYDDWTLPLRTKKRSTRRLVLAAVVHDVLAAAATGAVTGLVAYALYRLVLG